jgi:hypothetical protein
MLASSGPMMPLSIIWTLHGERLALLVFWETLVRFLPVLLVFVERKVIIR